MLRRFSTNAAVFNMFLDGGLIGVALFLSELIRNARNTIVPYLPSPFIYPNWCYLVFPLVWVAVLAVFSLYDTRKHIRVVDELSTLTIGSLFAIVALSGFLFFTIRNISRLLFLWTAVVAYFLLIGSHVGLRIYYRRKRNQEKSVRHILIIGNGPVGSKVADQVESYHDLGLKLVGFLDDDPSTRASNPQVLGCIEEMHRVIAEQDVEDVILALPSGEADKINRIVVDLHELPVKVWVVPDYYVLALNKAEIENMAGIPMIDLRAPALNEYQLVLKRSFDIILSILILPFALPVMGLIALAIRLESPGPILFKQKRVGYNGRLFEMYKFRSMIVDAEKHRDAIEKKDENGHIIQDKKCSDPRVTKVGAFIRKTSLDEIPQLINVLKGDMSIVGPRPELPYLVDQYEPWQRKRFGVPQGITGWWQVNGRSDKPMYLHTEDDLYYIQHYSFWLDIQILIKTFWCVLRRKGAY